MERKISQSVGIQLSTRVGGPDFVADFLRGVQGNVCLMSGRATGLNTSFDKVRNQLNAVLSDWTPVPDIYLDDVAATAGGFAKGAQRVIYVLEQDPPGACQNTVISACKVPARRWTFSLKVGAFATSTQSGM
jgi:hypothetical protein